jgi:hypothetical protein
LLWKVAQCPQVIEAYSTTVIGASGLPSVSSGSGPGFISSSTGTSGGAALRFWARTWAGKPKAPAREIAAKAAESSSAVRREIGALDAR